MSPRRAFIGLLDPLADKVLRHLATVSDRAKAEKAAKAARRLAKTKLRKKPPVRRGA